MMILTQVALRRMIELTEAAIRETTVAIWSFQHYLLVPRSRCRACSGTTFKVEEVAKSGDTESPRRLQHLSKNRAKSAGWAPQPRCSKLGCCLEQDVSVSRCHSSLTHESSRRRTGRVAAVRGNVRTASPGAVPVLPLPHPQRLGRRGPGAGRARARTGHAGVPVSGRREPARLAVSRRLKPVDRPSAPRTRRIEAGCGSPVWELGQAVTRRPGRGGDADRPVVSAGARRARAERRVRLHARRNGRDSHDDARQSKRPCTAGGESWPIPRWRPRRFHQR
jgi:hypothetical protein